MAYTKEAVEPGAEKYWLIRCELAVIYGTAMKSKYLNIPLSLTEVDPLAATKQ